MSAIATNNLRVWERFCVTPPAATKNFKKGGWSGTDINPAYRLKCLTELFGPQGIGWGWTIHEKWREVWPSRVKDGDHWMDYEAPCAFVMLSLWYMDGGEKKECSPQIGGTECDLAPDEVWKMSITDAVGKCCLALGIAADVYLGQFDGKYREGHDAPRQQRPAKPACPKCHKSEFVFANKDKPGFFCWLNKDKGKDGCGHKWGGPEEVEAKSNGKTKDDGPPPGTGMVNVPEAIRALESYDTPGRKKWRKAIYDRFGKGEILVADMADLAVRACKRIGDEDELTDARKWIQALCNLGNEQLFDPAADELTKVEESFKELDKANA